MKKFFANRYFVLTVTIAFLFTLILLRLFDLQWRQGEVLAADAVKGLEKKLRITGNRGKILDRNGTPLAYDQKSYQVVFYRDPAKRLGRTAREEDGKKITYGDVYTDVIRRSIKIIEENGGTSLSTFSIRRDEDGQYVMDFRTTNEDVKQRRLQLWIKNMYIPKEYEPTKGAEPITIYTNEDKKIIFNAEHAYWYLRKRYYIPADVSFEEAVKVLSVWQESQLNSYQSYNPVVLAKDVNMDTVAAVEMQKLDLDGMQIKESNVRIYPKKELAAHIVGYMGRMLDESTIMDYEAVGYSRNDWIGIAGIEKTMENYLSANLGARTGTRTVEVNSRGKVISVKSVDPATNGNSVVLTLDLKLQKFLEETLEQNIKEARSQQLARYQDKKEEIYDEKGVDIDNVDLAEVGAAVVMNIHTGEILAMASYPSYDPNIFTGGLTEAEYATIKDDTRRPLFNNAIASKSAPGSIFKMVTAMGGLMEGKLKLTDIIDCQDVWDKDIESGKKPECWTDHPQKHANQTVVEGLKNSCNYFFFTVADALGIDLLYKWGEMLGLTEKTNVELPNEKTSQVANKTNLYSSKRTPQGLSATVFYYIKNLIKDKCVEKGFDYEEDVYENAALKMMALVESGNTEWGPDIRAILMNDLKLELRDVLNTDDVNRQRMDTDITARLLEIYWNNTDTVLTGIGQSVTLLTPIAVARYISALVNGGNIYNARLVKSVLSPNGNIIEEKRPELLRSMDIPLEYTNAIKLGMKDVVSGEDGTAAKYFAGFKYIHEIAGKTGTAQVSTIDLENNSWFVGFAPYENPEIAIVCFIPNGYAGGLSAYTFKETVEFYMDRKEQQITAPEIPGPNSLTP